MLVMSSSYMALGIFIPTHILGSYPGKESFKGDGCIHEHSLRDALDMGLQVGVDIGLSKKTLKAFPEKETPRTDRNLYPLPTGQWDGALWLVNCYGSLC